MDMHGNRGKVASSKRGSMTTRPFKVLGIQQVAVGAADKSALRRLWVDTLGLAPHGNFKSEKENVDEDIVTMGAGPFTVEVDLMQPIDPERSLGSTRRLSITSVSGSTTSTSPCSGLAIGGCDSRLAGFVQAPPATAYALSTPRATRRPRSAAKAC